MRERFFVIVYGNVVITTEIHLRNTHTKTHKMINYLINECGIATGILGNPMYNL